MRWRYRNPSILLRSGIGNSDELKSVNIKTFFHAPEVGKNLHDHVLVRVGYGALRKLLYINYQSR